jgi:hypothetical protein
MRKVMSPVTSPAMMNQKMMKILPTRSVFHLSLSHTHTLVSHHPSGVEERKGDPLVTTTRLNDKVRKGTMRKVKKNVEMELEAAEDSDDDSH